MTLQGNVLTLNISQASYSNKEKVCICIAQTIPSVTSADTVVITIGAGITQYPLRTRNKRMQENIAEEVYMKLDEHMQKALSFHEQLNGTDYDVIAIHNMQDKYHEKYKNKYNDTYTDKWKK